MHKNKKRLHIMQLKCIIMQNDFKEAKPTLRKGWILI